MNEDHIFWMLNWDTRPGYLFWKLWMGDQHDTHIYCTFIMQDVLEH